MKAVELFAGAGGLGLGLSLAGFKPVAVVEWDKWACDTMRQNKSREYPHVRDWPVVEGDVREWIAEFARTRDADGIDLVAGGPPCQPFSMGGKHKAHKDRRDMFPAAVEVVRTLRPKAFIIENVKGLTRSSFANYYTYVKLQFEFPEVVKAPDESWNEHYERLQSVRIAHSPKRDGRLVYNIVPTLVNAADYGIPQRRERVFIVGFREDLEARWSFPERTHTLDALLYAQWVTGEYWDRHRIPKRNRPNPPPDMKVTIDRLRGLGLQPTTLPWRTVRDALMDLPAPYKGDLGGHFHNHRMQPGAKSYTGHTGSPLDMPAKTLKAGDHGVPGGENMMVGPKGELRYFTVRESARLQTFPDGYVFHGSWTETMRQLGNAVPVKLAHLVGASVAVELLSVEERRLVTQLRVAGARV
jgi:DNA (cytosine-5)-methyltransferase 1